MAPFTHSKPTTPAKGTSHTLKQGVTRRATAPAYRITAPACYTAASATSRSTLAVFTASVTPCSRHRTIVDPLVRGYSSSPDKDRGVVDPISSPVHSAASYAATPMAVPVYTPPEEEAARPSPLPDSFRPICLLRPCCQRCSRHYSRRFDLVCSHLRPLLKCAYCTSQKKPCLPVSRFFSFVDPLADCLTNVSRSSTSCTGSCASSSLLPIGWRFCP
jgi:hypothetical protein